MQNATQTVYRQLCTMADPEYKAFMARLIPNVPYDHIIGDRTPALRS